MISLLDEHKLFRSGRSCVHVVFVLWQIGEKSVEYNKPAFYDLLTCKSFNRLRIDKKKNLYHVFEFSSFSIWNISYIDDLCQYRFFSQIYTFDSWIIHGIFFLLL